MNIPVARPFLEKDELAKIEEVFNTGWLGMGSLVHEFENALKEYIAVKHIIAVNTGTSALHIALDSFGIEKGDEVIVPSLTFVATPNAALMCGAKVVFCDVEKETLNMDIKDAEKRITKKTRAIMPVHYSGLACNMDLILKLAKERNLYVVEDAAHAFGSMYKGKKIGSFGHAACFSFDPIKVITCGEGGAVATNNDKVAGIMMRKRIMGMNKDSWSRYAGRSSWFYNVKDLGCRYHMSNINAAIGIVQFGKMAKFLERRRKIAKMYDEELKYIEGIEIIKKDYDEVAPFNHIIKIKGNKRASLMEFLKKKGIETGVHYIPNHLQPLYMKCRAELPVTDMVWKQILTLPLYSNMTDKEADFVIKTIKDFFRKGNG